ncbi:MAG: phosphoribosyltransferase [Candidatus Aenigmarchaeota archaeon]|nr:phosphoribosyltransferase [Candidatus Aenigmarchaeota archaeon]
MDLPQALKGEPVDIFYIMDNGINERLPDNMPRAQEYRYYPPTHQDGSKREVQAKLYNEHPELGGLDKEHRLGKRCLLVDDVVFKGRTLRKAVKYVQALGYQISDIFIIARDLTGEWVDGTSVAPGLVHISHYDHVI